MNRSSQTRIIYTHITLVALMMVTFFSESGGAQNNIMFVAPKLSLSTNDIAKEFDKKIIREIPAVKTRVGFITYSDKDEGREISYNKIRASSIKYVLKLDGINDEGSWYELQFSLSEINCRM